MKGSAPYWPFVGFQVVEKIFQPWLVNHDEACWLVETAIRTRITSTSRPEPSATIWKVRSPSGRRSDSPVADPAGMAGSAFAAILMETRPSDRLASRCSWRSSQLIHPRQDGDDVADAEPILLSWALACWSRLAGSGA